MDKYYYRICEKKGDRLYTLFHSFEKPTGKSRELPMGEWLTAHMGPVWDGSRKTAKEYRSGFHVFKAVYKDVSRPQRACNGKSPCGEYLAQDS